MNISDIKKIYTAPDLESANALKNNYSPTITEEAVKLTEDRRKRLLNYLKEHGETRLLVLHENFIEHTRRTIIDDMNLMHDKGLIAKKYKENNNCYYRIAPIALI